MKIKYQLIAVTIVIFLFSSGLVFAQKSKDFQTPAVLIKTDEVKSLKPFSIINKKAAELIVSPEKTEKNIVSKPQISVDKKQEGLISDDVNARVQADISRTEIMVRELQPARSPSVGDCNSLRGSDGKMSRMSMGDIETCIGYDENGLPAYLVDPMGMLTTITNDDRRRPVQITESSGSITSFSYDANSRMNHVSSSICDLLLGGTCDSNISKDITHDPLGNVSFVRVTGAEDSRAETRYIYDKDMRLKAVFNPQNNLGVSYTYHNNDAVAQVNMCAVGNTGECDLRVINGMVSELDDDGRAYRESSPSGDYIITYTFDSFSRVIGKREQISGAVREAVTFLDHAYTYNDKGLLVKKELHDGSGDLLYSLELNYDQKDRIIFLESPIYDLTSGDQIGNYNKRYKYNEKANQVEEISTYNGEKTSVTYSYDDFDRLISSEVQGYGKVNITYDKLSRPVEIEDPSVGATQTFQYDAVGLSNISKTNGEQTHIRHNSLGQVIAEQDAVGNTVNMEYDGLYRPERVIVNGVKKIDYEYDAAGNVLSVLNAGEVPVQQTTYYGREAGKYGLPQTMVIGGGQYQFLNYDNGKVTRLQDPNGATFNLEYDGLGRVTGIGARSNANELFSKTFQFDDLGNIVKADYSGRNNNESSISSTYDSIGRPLTETHAIGEKTFVTRLDYGAYGIKQITHPSGYIVNYNYDKNGKLLSIEGLKEGAGKDIISSKSVKSVKSVKSLVSAKNMLPRYSWYQNYVSVQPVVHDARSVNMSATFYYDKTKPAQLNQIHYKNGNRVNYVYDEANRIQLLIFHRTEPNANQYTASLSRDTIYKSVSYKYDASGRVIATHSSYGKNTKDNLRDEREGYIYDESGYLVSRIDLAEGEYEGIDSGTRDINAIREIYTGRDRVSSNDFHWNYDADGNRVYYRKGQSSEQYRLNNLGMITGIERTSEHRQGVSIDIQVRGEANQEILRYDPKGNRLSKGSAQMMWDTFGNLILTVNEEGRAVYYDYDALGRRVRKRYMSANSPDIEKEIYYIWFGSNLIETVEVNKTVAQGNQMLAMADQEFTTDFLYSGGVDIMIGWSQENGEIYYTEQDLNNNVVALVNAQGAVEHYYDYLSYGDVNAMTWDGKPVDISEIKTWAMFAGREYDKETGNYYNRNRYYDPSVGVFISQDPIGIAGGINLYAYAANDPVNYKDAFGLSPDTNVIGQGAIELGSMILKDYLSAITDTSPSSAITSWRYGVLSYGPWMTMRVGEAMAPIDAFGVWLMGDMNWRAFQFATLAVTGPAHAAIAMEQGIAHLSMRSSLYLQRFQLSKAGQMAKSAAMGIHRRVLRGASGNQLGSLGGSLSGSDDAFFIYAWDSKDPLDDIGGFGPSHTGVRLKPMSSASKTPTMSSAYGNMPVAKAPALQENAGQSANSLSSAIDDVSAATTRRFRVVERGGQQFVEFKAADAKFINSRITPNGNMTPDTLAGVTDTGTVVIYEGKHRAVGAAKGDIIPSGLGAVTNKVGWLRYEYAGTVGSGKELVPVIDLIK